MARGLMLAALMGAAPGGAAGDDQGLVQVYRGAQADWPAPHLDEGVPLRPLAPLPEQPSYPKDNPDSAEKRRLGKTLFFDPRLSRSGQIACASCHDPDLGWADGRRRSFGHDRHRGLVNAPTIINSGYLDELFWDGRAASLEDQVLASWSNPIEMAADPQSAAERLGEIKGYRKLFQDAFGDAEISPDTVRRAIATFMRSVTLSRTPYDRFLAGESEAMTDAQIRGLHVFRTEGRCMNCHNGALLSDGDYHHLGTSFYAKDNFQGRYAISGKAENVGEFRTAPLRGVTETGPWMHNGLIDDLDAVLVLYNNGWWQNTPLDKKIDDIPFSTLSPRIQPLHLTPEQLADLRAFLDALSGSAPAVGLPSLPGR
ncbi:MAG: cytochrome-c peroxidase [Alcanivorax sp.]|nr:MAG: cytochrome-c peroxidase [Alcanivorax sp.]